MTIPDVCRASLAAGILALAAGSIPAASIDGDAGTRGYKFLQMNPNAATMALSGAFAADRGAVASVTANPAGLVSISRFSFAASHAEWLSTVRYDFAGAALRRFDGVVAVSLRTQTSGNIPLRSADMGGSLIGIPSPVPLGTYGLYDGALTVGYARSTQVADIGVSASYVYEKIHTATASAIAASVGAQRRMGDFTLGAAARNFGYSSRLREDRTPLPWDMQVGGSYERRLYDTPLRAVADVRYAPDWYETAHVGAEATLAGALALRLGYESGITKNVSTAGFSGGAGFVRGRFRVDYAYQPNRVELGGRHVFAVTIAE
jgi:hypothetical protein